MIAGIVNKDNLTAYWPIVEPMIAKACLYSGDCYGSDDYFQDIESGKKTLWAAVEQGSVKGIAIVQLLLFPHKKCAYIDMFTGTNVNKLLMFLPLIEAWAKENGCVRIYSNARKGYLKKLKDYSCKHIIIHKDL